MSFLLYFYLQVLRYFRKKCDEYEYNVLKCLIYNVYVNVFDKFYKFKQY